MSTLVHKTDDELLFLLRNNDHRAFREIFSRYDKRLYRYICSKVQDQMLSEDMLHDVFSNLWEHRQSLEIRLLSAYLYHSARNRIIDYARSEKVREKYAAHFARLPRYDNSNEERQALTDLETTLEKEVATLPRCLQTAFRLSRYEHIPNSEIAKRMSISPRTVERYISRALAHLRGSLGEFMVWVLWVVS